MHRFETGSPTHYLCLIVSVLAFVAYAVIARRHREGKFPWLPRALAVTCLIAWIVNTAMAFDPKTFRWDVSIPLYYCNWANLIAAASLLSRNRILDGMLYYWACGLSIWAFATPTLEYGPARAGFWIFWIYHLCIVLAVCHLLVAERFRPNLRDMATASAVTIGYGIVVAIINAFNGWNYAFLGKSAPDAPTPIDFLGPWPLRLLWLALLSIVLFFMITVPWMRFRKAPQTG